MVTKFEKDSTHQPFDADAIGASFRELGVDVVSSEKVEFVSRWFRSARADADLTIWMDQEQRLVKHQISFFGQVVEWNPIHGTRTGVIIEEEMPQGLIMKNEPEVSVSSRIRTENEDAAGDEDRFAEHIHFDEVVQMECVRQAIRLLESVSVLSDIERSQMINNLKESPQADLQSREKMMSNWAPRVECSVAKEVFSNRRPSFWKRLRKWINGTRHD
jgi:hypothetical protein